MKLNTKVLELLFWEVINKPLQVLIAYDFPKSGLESVQLLTEEELHSVKEGTVLQPKKGECSFADLILVV